MPRASWRACCRSRAWERRTTWRARSAPSPTGCWITPPARRSTWMAASICAACKLAVERQATAVAPRRLRHSSGSGLVAFWLVASRRWVRGHAGAGHGHPAEVVRHHAVGQQQGPLEMRPSGGSLAEHYLQQTGGVRRPRPRLRQRRFQALSPLFVVVTIEPFGRYRPIRRLSLTALEPLT